MMVWVNLIWSRNANTTYYAEWQDEKGKTYKTDLPAARPARRFAAIDPGIGKIVVLRYQAFQQR